jgi:sugar lactone lactonase YvrE
MVRIINDTTVYVSVLAGSTDGSADGIGTNAQFSHPAGLALSPTDNIIYVADASNNRIRAISLSTTQVTTLAGSSAGYSNAVGTNAKFDGPLALVFRTGYLYVSDSNNNAIRAINIGTKQVTTLAGDGTAGSSDGTGTNAQLNAPIRIAGDTSGWLWVTDNGNNAIRKVKMSTGQVITVVGGTSGTTDGVGTAAELFGPYAIAADDRGDVFFADTYNDRIRRFDNVTYTVTTIAGNLTGYADGIGTNARFYSISSVVIDSYGLVYVADAGNNRIRYFNYA